MRTWPPSPGWPTPAIRELAPRRGELPYGLASALERDRLREALLLLAGSNGPRATARELNLRGRLSRGYLTRRGGFWNDKTVRALAHGRIARALWPREAAAACAALAVRRTEEL